ncbi:hypothetical protein EJ05DRAFT_199857 [Pseudovirgaria hyperparasitica]|uniref:Uncharacterized protein n=1 Tax=Pseudovirgaria hyperparasitica TaxID=470096 RepID=A0A6A6WJ56_9PEZI|nr:uncharacterized protein EJ05DRAFT_199857 [Pseudovirgaria hyperparasitica]KAF2762176.1 hypothetical protein EJ05DRAFT_199857 [Pseudovirgaria hyperparasitica]
MIHPIPSHPTLSRSITGYFHCWVGCFSGGFWVSWLVGSGGELTGCFGRVDECDGSEDGHGQALIYGMSRLRMFVCFVCLVVCLLCGRLKKQTGSQYNGDDDVAPERRPACPPQDGIYCTVGCS